MIKLNRAHTGTLIVAAAVVRSFLARASSPGGTVCHFLIWLHLQLLPDRIASSL